MRQTVDLPIREGDVRRLYLLQHPLAIIESAGPVVAAAVALLNPQVAQATAVWQLMPAVPTYLWLVMLALGGLSALAGIVRLSTRLESAGLIYMATALGTYAIALESLHHERGRFVAVLLGTWALGLVARAVILLVRPEVRPWAQRSPS